MATTVPLTERTTTAVLFALWNQPETNFQNLLTETRAPLSDVQQSLQLLRERNCQIEQTPTSIRLVSVGLPCWQDILQQFAGKHNLRIANRVLVFTRTGSTNDIAWRAASNSDNQGLLVLADEQSAGRGAFGNSWEAKAGQSILLSLLLQNARPESLDRLTLLAGLAAANAIEQVVLAATGHRLSIQIKWPNDLLLENRKLAGILVERRGNHVVIGIGVNVAQTSADFRSDLAPRTASLYQATAAHIDRLRIIAALTQHLDGLVDPPNDHAWLSDWKSRCQMLGSRITARTGDQLISGQIIDIDPLHGLVLRDVAGAIHFLSSSTTSLTT